MSDELVKIQPNSLAMVPDYLTEVKGHEGMENVKPTDLVLPRLAIAQSTTPQKKKQNPLYIEGLEEGMFFDTVINDIFGESIEIIPLIKTNSRIWFKDLKEGGGILCRSQNGIDGGSVSPTCGACPKSKWRDGGKKPPECTEYLNFPAVIAGQRRLIVTSWKSTALGPARQWLTKIEMLVEKWNKPLYSWACKVTLKPDSNESGDYFVPTFLVSRWATKDEFAFAAKAYNDLKDRTIVVDAEEVDTDEENAPF